MTTRPGLRILVPILGGDIGPATFAWARAALQGRDASLVLLDVIPRDAGVMTEANTNSSSPASPPAGATPRWRRLARGVPTFLDALKGDPASVILSQAERFRSDLVLLERPAVITRQNAWIADAITRLERTAPGRVRVLVEPASGRDSQSARSPRVLRSRTRTVEASC